MFNNLLLFTEEDRRAILSRYDKTVLSVQNDVTNLKNWLQKQPHLPETPSDHELEHFLLMNKFSVERAKTMVDWFYTIPSYIPEFFNKDPNHPSIRTVMDYTYCVPLPKLTPDLNRIVIIKFVSGSVEDFNIANVCAHVGNIWKVILLKDCALGEIIIFDLSNFNFAYWRKVTPMVIKKISLAMQKVYRNRIPAMHFINAPSFMDTLMGILKMVLKPKMLTRINIDKETSSLLACYPKEILPEDYSGTEKSLKELNGEWRRSMSKNNDWFVKRNQFKVNEKLRLGNLDDNDLFGLDGNFRKLEVD